MKSSFKIILLPALHINDFIMDKNALNISLFYCSGSIDQNELYNSGTLNEKFAITPINLSCSGRVSIQYLLKAIEKGADGVVLLTCPINECNYVEGNLRAAKRVMAVNSILRESGFQEDRVKIVNSDTQDSTKQIIEKIINACNSLAGISQKVTVS